MEGLVANRGETQVRAELNLCVRPKKTRADAGATIYAQNPALADGEGAAGELAGGPDNGGAEALGTRSTLEGAPHKPVLLVWELYSPPLLSSSGAERPLNENRVEWGTLRTFDGMDHGACPEAIVWATRLSQLLNARDHHC